jgi:hypothetical protein
LAALVEQEAEEAEVDLVLEEEVEEDSVRLVVVEDLATEADLVLEAVVHLVAAEALVTEEVEEALVQEEDQEVDSHEEEVVVIADSVLDSVVNDQNTQRGRRFGVFLFQIQRYHPKICFALHETKWLVKRAMALLYFS